MLKGSASALVIFVASCAAAYGQAKNDARPEPASIAVSVHGGLHPVIDGTVDLPNGVEVLVALYKARLPDAYRRQQAGLSPCGTSCGSMRTRDFDTGAMTPMSGGHFHAGPFTTFQGGPVEPGFYQVHVSFLPPDGTNDEEEIEQNEMLRDIMFNTIVWISD